MDCSPLGSSIHGVSLGKNTGVSCHALPLQGTFPGIKPRSPTLQVDSLPSEPPGSGYPIPSSADLPNPGIEPGSPALQADSLPAELPGKPFYIPAISPYSQHLMLFLGLGSLVGPHLWGRTESDMTEVT